MKKILLFFAGLLCLLFTNCSDVDYGTGNGIGNSGKLAIQLTIPGSTINTYATVEAVNGEDQVHTLYVLFFESSMDASGKFLDIHDISPDAGNYYESGQTIELDLEGSSTVDKSKAYNLLLIANPNYYLPTGTDWKSYFSGMTENEVVQLRMDIETNGSSNDYSFTPFHQDALPMSGSIRKEAGDELIMAELTRIVCRFDIQNSAAGYTLVSASVGNAFPEQTVWESGNYSDFTLPRIPRLYGINVTGNEVKGGLYAYENFVVQTAQNDDITTCLIVGMRKDGENVTKYFRINLSQSGNIQQLKRNHVYTVKIKSVKGSGSDSEGDAKDDPDSKINVQINEWNEDEQGNIVSDGDNVLAISTTNIIFDKDGGSRQYSVFTAGEGTLAMTNKELPDGFTAELKGNVLYVTATPSEVDKYGYVQLQFGTLSTTVKITQIGEIEEYLEVTPTMLPAISSADNQVTDVVTVTSSGPWTATLYNAEDVFVYTSSNGNSPISGDDKDTFTITARKENAAVQNRYAFVLVTLDSNPEISAVTVVTQTGFDGFEILPEPGVVPFDANGDQMKDPEEYTFTIKTKDDNDWSVSLSGTDKNSFDYILDKETGKVTIVSKGINPQSTPLSAQLRIYLDENPAVYRDIPITQAAHSLTVTPTTFATVPAEGGNSELITVNATAPWTATISNTGNTAVFLNENGEPLDNISGPAGEYTFQVKFPGLTTAGVSPQAIVNVSLNNTYIEQSLLIKQAAVVAKKIVMQNTNNLYGYLINNDNSLYRTNYVEQLYQSLINTSWFGPSGTVQCGGVSFVPLFVTPNEETDIFVMNSFNGSAADGAKIQEWRDKSPNRVILALSDDRSNTLVSYLGMSALGYIATGGTGNNVVKTDFPRTINKDDKYTVETNNLYKYLLKTGPFTNGTEIPKDQIKLLPYDASNNCMTAWPSTMIPLILDEENPGRMIMGVDPTLRLIYVGEMDLFTTNGVPSISFTENGITYTGVNNYYDSPYAENNLKFLNNLIAWMFNVVMYGDEFTNQFK